MPPTPPPPAAPGVALPKGGGSVRGIGEKFAANPVTGTGSMSVPVWTSPGRDGFGPSLSLSYDSGSGNGPFGLGWTMPLATITRRTDKGVPRYDDDAESDVFVLAGAEDLVPVLDPVGVRASDVTTAPGYTIDRYHPRVEGLFSRIERWTRDDGAVHWRTIARTNVVSLFGADERSRISDPADPRRVFSWLLCEARDDRGNAVLYDYKPDGGDGIDLALASEVNRGDRDDPRRRTNRYLKRVRYGNRTSLLRADGTRPRFLADLPAAVLADVRWMFEVVFDYGEHDDASPTPAEVRPWPVRPDPSSSYRSGFEVRTSRRCRRILAFHHIPDGADGSAGYDGAVRATDLGYVDDHDPPGTAVPVYSLLRSVAQRGLRRRADGGYDESRLPPVEFTYSLPVVDETVRSVDPANLEHLPIGVDGATYRWIDLHGDGLPGVFSEQAEAWWYTPNVTPLDGGAVRFDPTELVAVAPVATLTRDRARFADLAGDGQPDVVTLGGPVRGLFEHGDGADWQPFRPFSDVPTIDLLADDVSFVDLDGDGRADLLMAYDGAWTWHQSLGELGFGPQHRVAAAGDDELGPRPVVMGRPEALLLADLSGDGLSDLVRIRNGDVSYWPNLGHGRFGARVVMDHAPWFDHPEQFDPARVRLADLDGSGTTDIVYLHADGVRLYFNQSGNRWSEPMPLAVRPEVDQSAAIEVTDLLGNGTVCIVWSDRLTADGRPSMRYVNLMGAHKPHLLVDVDNNLGTATQISYLPSTHFSIGDRRAGRPWRTRLPFPVHVVARVETRDLVGRAVFVNRFAYHDGYFDGEDREFRGFAMVEQWDTDDIDPPVGDLFDRALVLQALHTKTWYDTGAPDDPTIDDWFSEPGLDDDEAAAQRLRRSPLPTALTAGLAGSFDADARREARRAMKGQMLRQEVYAEDGSAQAGVPYSVTEQCFMVRRLQPRGPNRHAVFLTHADETLTWHYERDAADPRIRHVLTLEADRYGTTTKQAEVAYGRRATVRRIDEDGRVEMLANPGFAGLEPEDREVQTRALVTYTETTLTNRIDEIDAFPDDLRTPVVCGATAFQLTGHEPTGPAGRFVPSDLVAPDDDGRLRPVAAMPIAYEVTPGTGPRRRTVDMTRTVFSADDASALLPFGTIQPRGLTGETYRLAFTPGLVDTTFRRALEGAAPQPLLSDVAAVLGSPGAAGGGYVSGEALAAALRLAPGEMADGWWIGSGTTAYRESSTADTVAERDAAIRHFFVPRRYRDPFGHDTVVRYDEHELLPIAHVDAIGNIVVAEQVDYRVLQPSVVTDANGNQAAVAFDALGLVAGSATMGKPAPALAEGDSLAGFVTDLTAEQIDELHDAADPHTVATALLGGATTRVVYDLGRFQRSRSAAPDDPTAWLPASTATLSRETHVSDEPPAGGLRIQIAFSYSDGFARVVQRKIQAEPGPVVVGDPAVSPRWVGTGCSVFNNKGSAVRQYEPFFSRQDRGHHFEYAATFGVSPVVFYDPTERVVAALNPNHTYTKVRFDAWRQVTYDVNDTCAARGRETGDPRTDPDVGALLAAHLAVTATNPAEPWETWAAPRLAGRLGPHELVAAQRAAAHADTPTTVHLDPLARPFLTTLHNRIEVPDHPQDGFDELIAQRVDLDVDGNLLSVRDGVTDALNSGGGPTADRLGRPVASVVYDLLGRAIRDASFEGGTRWTLPDVAGKTIRRWDQRGHGRRTSHDPLRRVTHVHVVRTGAPGEVLVERQVYGEQHPDAAELNLRGTLYLHLDQAGALANDGNDFKGNPLGSTRRLTSGTQYRNVVDWAAVDAAVPAAPTATLDLGALAAVLDPRLDAEAFTSRYDALDRPRELTAPHTQAAAASVVRNVYNAANLLERVEVNVRGEGAAGEPVFTTILADVDYDAKGQRRRLERGNGVVSDYDYDPATFRLVRVRTTRPSGAFPDDAPQPPVDGWPGAGVQDLAFTYDPSGNITNITAAAQQRIFFANRRVDASNDYAYDAAYQLVWATGREHLGQDEAPNSATDEPRVGVAWGANDGNAMASYTERYRYDRAGNLLEHQHASSEPARSWTRTPAYDEPSQLDEPGAAVTHRNNRLSSVSAADPAETLTYDAHGNVVRMSHLGGGAATPNLDWNHADQLSRVDHGGGGVTYHVYDAGGRLIRSVREKSASLVEERIDLGDVDLFRRRQGGERFERETLHVRDGRNRVAVVETRTVDTAGTDDGPARLVRHQLADHLASVHVELDHEARLITFEEYAPFGATTYQAVRNATDAPKRFRYTGHERDDGTGLYAMGARYYASWLCRWISCDPAGIGEGLNRYEYVANNPVRHVDTTGRGLFDKAKAFVSDGANRAVAAVKPGGAVFEAVDSAFKPDQHPVAAAVLNNMAKRGEGLVEGVSTGLKNAGNDLGDIAYSATHLSEPGAKKQLNAAIERRQKAPVDMAIGMVTGFGGTVKRVGNALGDVAYYRPELLAAAGPIGMVGAAALPSHKHEEGADAKVASAITDIVLDGPQIVLAVEGGASIMKGGANMIKGGAGGSGSAPLANVPKPTGPNPVAVASEAKLDAAIGKMTSDHIYRGPVSATEAGHAVETMVPVSRWGRSGLEAGDWVMTGPPSWSTYLKSFKWEPSWPFLPRNMRNIPAARGAGQGFIVPAEHIVRPAGTGIDGWIKGVYGQRKYQP